jgi:Ca2+-binding EF-hand superfamily protein
VKEELQADSNQNVTVDQLRDFILGIVEPAMIDQKITKRDVEGFLSAFSYNAYGATNIESIAKLIYTRDDLVPEKLAERKWANPPPADVNKDVDTSAITPKDMHNERIKSLLSEIEDKVFVGKTKMFQLFRRFDVDGDGYMSHQDFDTFIKSIKVEADKKEVASILKLLDTKNQGFLTYTEFSKVFSPQMSAELVNTHQNESHMPNMVPSDEMYKYNQKNQHKYNERVKQIRDTFKPDMDQSKSTAI